jgi:hypothetical protein
MTSPNMDPRLLPSVTDAKGKDVEARLVQHLAAHPAAPPALSYGQNQGVVTQTGNGTYTWTAPATVTSAKIECIGAGAGGGGGSSSRGGEGGGGGEYSCEPAYPIVPGQVYTYVVGNGGSGGTTGNGGSDGGATLFDTTAVPGGLAGGVFANGGGAGAGFVGGPGGGRPGQGGPSGNTIENPGGSGGGNGSQGTGGCGGGAPAGPVSSGANGGTSGGSSGASGGTGGGGNGGNSGANGSNGSTPGAGGGGCGAATSATSGQNTYRLNSSATYFGSDATGGNANAMRSGIGGTMWQGGEQASGGSYNGTQKSLGVIGGNPQSDLSGKTIDSVSIRLEQNHTWYNNGSYVILGYTNRSSLPSSWNAGGITGVKTWWQGPATDQGGHAVTTDLTGQGLGSALQSGAAQSISLGPGSSYNLNNYAQFYGAGGDNSQNPLITVNWHTGSAPVQAGGGADGKVVITYYTAGVLQAALQPAAGTDPAGNSFAAGYTGPVTAVQPGTSPSVAEAWHDFPAGVNSWGLGTGGWKKYRLLSTGSVEVSISLRLIGTKTDGTAIFSAGALPAGYTPALGRKLLPAIVNTNALSGNWPPTVSFNTDGSVTVFGVNATGLVSLDCHGTIPLI